MAQDKLRFPLAALLATLCINALLLRFIPPLRWLAPILLLLFLALNAWPAYRAIPDRRLRALARGGLLLKLFAVSTVLTVLLQAGLGIGLRLYAAESRGLWFAALGAAVVCEAILFWHGMLRVYLCSVQLGVKLRVLAAVFGWVPVLHLYYLHRVISVVDAEVRFETEKLALNAARADDQICATKHPLLLVHGVFFRDSRYFNYWGRIPAELEKNGATIYYGNQQSALPVAESAAELAARIRALVRETGCEKVNVIAHSKGGLDIRYAIANCGAAQYVASVTTVNTPHRGCEFADYLFEKIPERQKQRLAHAYNAALRKFGETPDFLAAVYDLTAARCKAEFDPLPLPAGIYSASVGSRLDHASGGRFPLNFSYRLVNHFDGPNDGLVSERSCRWGEDETFLTAPGRRGISHGDMIDLNRENIPGFDVREFYVQLVRGLKDRGL